jgi:hypothetical protein
MGSAQLRGKSVAAIAKEIADGFVFLNPIVLKTFEAEDYKSLRFHLQKLQKEVRAEKFPFHDTAGLRQRNQRLQHLHGALIVLEHAAREKRIPLA